MQVGYSFAEAKLVKATVQ